VLLIIIPPFTVRSLGPFAPRCLSLRSARLDSPDLCGAFVDRYHGQFALALDRQAAEVIHDRLPLVAAKLIQLFGLIDARKMLEHGKDALFVRSPGKE
jgi:hypothetical protein